MTRTAPARTARLVTALTIALLVTLAAAPHAIAAAPESQGWWWRAQSGVLAAVPAPPQVPPDGLYVEGAPDGPSAVSALRFRLPDGVVGVSLVLKVAQEQGGEAAVLLACPAASPWVPAIAGRWDDRPAAACEGRGVLGQRAEDGSTWTFPLTLAPATGLVELVLLPGVDDSRPEAFNGSVFSIAFAAPDQDTLVTRAAGSSQPTFDPPPPTRPPPDFGGSTFTPPASTGPPGVWPDPAAQPEAETAVPDPSVIPPRVTPRVPVTGTDPLPASKDARALATLIALLSVGVAGVMTRDRAVVVPGMRPAKPLESTEDRLGGIGRFRRPRSAPPPPL